MQGCGPYRSSAGDLRLTYTRPRRGNRQSAWRVNRPGNRMRTARQHIIDLLRGAEMSAQDISRAVGIREKQVYDHLPHIAKTLAGRGETFVMTPPECLSCGYTFSARSRFTRPGRCPRCRATRVTAPAFRVS